MNFAFREKYTKNRLTESVPAELSYVHRLCMPSNPFLPQKTSHQPNPMKPFKLLSLALVLLAIPSAHAVTIIYQDDFGGGTGDINGLAPVIGASNWVAAPMFNANGTIVNADTASIDGGSATLAFTPAQGLIYTLDLSLTGLNGDTNWIGFGFANGQSDVLSANSRFINSPTPTNNGVIGRAWMLVRGDGTATNKASMNGTASHVDWSPDFATGGSVDLRVVLDTTAGSTNWTATWFAKLTADTSYTQVRAEADIVTETITSVGFARSNDGVEGTATFFQLSSIPEPSTALLGGLGLLALLRRRR